MCERISRIAIGWYASIIVAGCAPLLLAARPPQNQQQPSPAPSGQNSEHPVHKVRVWTNEDLIETRTPADRYIFAKEDRAAEDRAAEFQSIASCFAPGNQPELTQEQAQKEIVETTQAIRNAEQGVAQAKRQVAEDPENLRTRDQAELNRRNAELNLLLEHLHALQVRVQEAGAQSTAAPASSSASPPAPQP
jgi:hypothetical protein